MRLRHIWRSRYDITSIENSLKCIRIFSYCGAVRRHIALSGAYRAVTSVKVRATTTQVTTVPDMACNPTNFHARPAR